MSIEVDKLHVTESLTRLGGVETLLKQLLAGDPGSYAVALLDNSASSSAKGYGLRIGKFAGEWFVKCRAARLFSHIQHLVFHNFAGMTMLSAALPHERRTLFLHTNSSDVFDLLPLRLPYLDGIITSGEDLAREVRERLPNLIIPVTGVEYPLDDRFFETHERPVNPIMVLGYSGRLEIEQKQVFRLVELCAALKAKNIIFRLEIAGSGSAEAELRSRLPAESCRFLGVLATDALHKACVGWDFVICTSDYETGPLSVMEAMAVGCVPVMPDIPCQASQLLADVGLNRYKPGNLADAADLLISLKNDPSLGTIRDSMRSVVADRRLARYVSTLDSILNHIAEQPSRSRPFPVNRGFASILPFALRTDPFLGLR